MKALFGCVEGSALAITSLTENHQSLENVVSSVNCESVKKDNFKQLQHVSEIISYYWCFKVYCSVLVLSCNENCVRYPLPSFYDLSFFYGGGICDAHAGIKHKLHLVNEFLSNSNYLLVKVIPWKTLSGETSFIPKKQRVTLDNFQAFLSEHFFA